MSDRGVLDGVYLLLGQEKRISEQVHDDPIIECVDELLHRAVATQASDIHLQPSEKNLRVRYRIDGTLYDQPTIEQSFKDQVISRLKILSSLDIAQRRVPQDGKFKVQLSDDHGDIIDFRVSTFPVLHGEKMVIRILNREQRLLDLASLGLKNEMLSDVLSFLQCSHGLLLVTGPTGSGKTTTLYAMLSALNSAEKNIVTMEDPIEYEIEGITQSQVNLKAGFTFENGLRSLLRQDPDIILIGEIRDVPTAQIAIEAALTGHLVISTLHTNDAAGAVTRLLDMGIEPFLISSALIGVIGQRLSRKLCTACKHEAQPTVQEQEASQQLFGEQLETIFQPQGCAACLNLGYQGRMGIFELLKIDDAIKSMILTQATHQEILSQAKAKGMLTMLADGREKFSQGVLSLEELLALTQD